MEEYTGTENFGPSHYDLGFDFEVDLTFSFFDYLLIGCYTIFVLPFVWLGHMFSQVIQRYKSHKQTEKTPELQSSIKNDLISAPCCPWPRTSHN